MIETELDGAANPVDEEIKGMSLGYSMGGMTLAAHHNEGENMGGSRQNEVRAYRDFSIFCILVEPSN